MTEEIIFNKEDVVDHTYIIRTLNEATGQYKSVAAYPSYESAVQFAKIMQKDQDTIVVSRKHIIAEVIKDEVVDSLPSDGAADGGKEDISR